ncbi:hypothetical protein [Paenibacillus chitinolyticus]|uniref:hypothetical protein n=1 Tax=Paenibacillus TaxID=44249 RepID=UPI001C487CA1|nr:hypothetical protein [Paenibacillus chitinolyticus]MBV6713639.1 hypothetical protein [Paenibacillus chitinolyticus]
MNQTAAKFVMATAILVSPAAGTALKASAQTAAVQAQPAVQPAGQGVQAVQAAPSGTLSQAGISGVKTESREILREFGGAGNFSPSVVTKTPA